MKEAEISQRERQIAGSRFHRANRAIIAGEVKGIKNGRGDILEIGCGHGDVTREYIAPNCASVIATDIVDNFRLGGPGNITFRIEDAMSLSFPDESLDGVVSLEVIEHVKDDVGYVRESLRVLKKGGTLLFTTPNRLRLSSVVRYLVGRPLRFPHSYGHDAVLGDILHLREYSLSDLRTLTGKFGVASAKVTGVWLGVPSLNLGIAEPPKCLQRFAFNWHVKMVK